MADCMASLVASPWLLVSSVGRLRRIANGWYGNSAGRAASPLGRMRLLAVQVLTGGRLLAKEVLEPPVSKRRK
jgi:hypothetical protein